MGGVEQECVGAVAVEGFRWIVDAPGVAAAFSELVDVLL